MIYPLLLVATATRPGHHHLRLGTDESSLKEAAADSRVHTCRWAQEKQNCTTKIGCVMKLPDGQVPADKRKQFCWDMPDNALARRLLESIKNVPVDPEHRKDIIGGDTFLKQILTAISYWTDDQKEQATKAVLKGDTEDPLYEILQYLGVAEKRSQRSGGGGVRPGAVTEARTHREFLKKGYYQCQHMWEGVTPQDIKVHDLSKFDWEEFLGYTCKWRRDERCPLDGKLQRDLSKLSAKFDDNKYVNDGLRMGGNDLWGAAIQHHYDKNEHHPEHWKPASMPDSKLIESVLDTIVSIWEREGPQYTTVYQFLTARGKWWTEYPENVWGKDKYTPEDKEKVDQLLKMLVEKRCGEPAQN